MTNQIVGILADEVAQTIGVIDSAVVLIQGIQQRIADAVTSALANGATADELAPFTQLEADLEAKRTALADAVAANQ